MSAVLPTQSFFERMFDRLIASLSELKPRDIQKVKILTEPYKTTKTLIDRATTTATVEPTNPQIEMKNPIDDDMRVTAITIIPNENFKTKGILRLLINGVEELKTKEGDLTDYSTLNIPIANEGKLIERNKGVSLHIWTSDGTSSSVTLQASFAR